MAVAAIGNRPRLLGALAGRGVLFMMLLLVAVRTFAAGVTLAWDPATTSGVTGYKLYYGASAGSYTTNLNVGSATSYTVSGLAEGATYHFAVTAYDSLGRESGFSNDLTVAIPSSVPVAGFSASATSGVAPLAINFVNASTGNITSYAWSFGDGTTSTAQSPAKVYNTAGVYTVSLTVTGPGGSNTLTRTNYVTVTAPATAPVAAFTANQTTGTAPLSVNFTSTSTGSITSYAWSFGDGTTSAAQNPTKVYSTAGVYTVRLTVTGPGGSNTMTRTNYVTVTATATAPVAGFAADRTSGTTPLTVSFVSTSTGTISNYAWSFGDGTTSAAQHPTKVYSTAGVYTVRLTVTGPGGSNTMTRTNYVTATTTATAPVAAFTANAVSGVAPLTVYFRSASTGTITSYYWSFGDGTSSTLQSPSKVYSVPGVYTVKLTVTGPGGSNTLTKTNYITVTTQPRDSAIARKECASPPAGTIFCEDFEGSNPKANFDDYDGNLDTENQIIADAGPSGKSANKVVRFRAPAGQPGGADLLKVLPGSYDKLYARWYVQYEPGFNFAASNHGGGLAAGGRNYIGASGSRPTGADFAGFYPQYEPGSAEPYAYSYYRGMYQDCGPAGSCWGDSLPCVYGDSYCTKAQDTPATALPKFQAGRWHCLEQMVDLGTPTATDTGANGRLTLWLDGQQIGDFANLWIRMSSGLKLQHLWLTLHHHDGTHSIPGQLIDNVVVSTQRIGC